jgi:hypothetical protein
MLCEHTCCFLCGSYTLCASARVRITAVDKNGLSNSSAEVQAINYDGRGDHSILSENPGDRTALF